MIRDAACADSAQEPTRAPPAAPGRARARAGLAPHAAGPFESPGWG